MTAAPTVNVPELAWRLIALPAVLSWIAPEVVNAPLLFTVIPPPVSLMPVTVKGAAVFVNCTLPLAPLVFVALKLPTVFAPFKVVPVAETVVNNPVVLNVPPVSVTLPAAVTLIGPAPVATAAWTATLPDVTVVRLIVSVKVPVTAAPTVNVPELAWRLIVLPAVLSWIAPEVVNAPVLFTVIPPPVSLMPVTVNSAAVFVNCTLPLAPLVFVALKLPTVFAPVKVVPVAETVVNNRCRTQRYRQFPVDVAGRGDVDRPSSGRDRARGRRHCRTSPSRSG